MKQLLSLLLLLTMTLSYGQEMEKSLKTVIQMICILNDGDSTTLYYLKLVPKLKLKVFL
jgi:hypothetical protein